MQMLVVEFLHRLYPIARVLDETLHLHPLGVSPFLPQSKGRWYSAYTGQQECFDLCEDENEVFHLGLEVFGSM